MKNDNNQGYVYILTNESFREDWVKIGKSSRPVDVRSKELDNTAVPLPFNIYATIKTVKYNEVEKMVHRQIDRLTDLRIRRNREFFNIKPEVALEIFFDLMMAIDDAEVEVYKDGMVESTYQNTIATTAPPTADIFSINSIKGCQASGYYDEVTQHFVVLKGSVMSGEVSPSYKMTNFRTKIKREHCAEVDGKIVLQSDTEFNSPSLAAGVFLGIPVNGWICWKDKDKKTLDEVYRKK